MPTPHAPRRGTEVRAYREKLGVTQVQVVRTWGRSQPQLSRIENDRMGVSDRAYEELLAAIDEAARRLRKGEP